MQSSTLQCQPIGYFNCLDKDRYALPKQAGLGKDNQGKILLNPHQNFEQALEDLAGFTRIWVVFWFHLNTYWKPKVLTPHGEPKRGLFSTRSPHRPNPIGISCLELLEIKGLELYIAQHDLVDGTPILDIKPYLEYADAWIDTRQGWLEEYTGQQKYAIQWTKEAQKQVDYLKIAWNLALQDEITFRLKNDPLPRASNRIKKLEGDHQFQLAYKTWRIHYRLIAEKVEIQQILSGYDQETLKGLKQSKWQDVGIHQDFIVRFETC